jgi:ribosomal protein S18 acetylase RimI-like enzyme
MTTVSTRAPAINLRVARHTERLEEVVAFYRDGIGLVEIGRFAGHAGYDGVFLEIPGTGAHLELTTGGAHGVPAPHPESLLVLYLGDADAVAAVARRLGAAPVVPANPYWAERGSTFEDPDGFPVVLVPERWTPEPAGAVDTIRVERNTAPRAAIRPLFELAEDSAAALDAYIDAGDVLVALDQERVVGHVQVTEGDRPGEAEIKNMAVAPSHQGRGIGRRLVEAAAALAARDRRSTLAVATAAADTGNLRFYQRAGFRMRSVERDAFTPTTGYASGIIIDGIELRDRVWLDRPVRGPKSTPG